MENDSLNVENSDTASTDSAITAPEIELPTPEQLGITISTGQVGPLTVGDTFDFPVTVSWSVQGSALLVVPTSSVNAKGLTQVAMSQQSARSVKDGAEVASITFTYKVAAQDTGDLHIPALRFEIPTQVGRPLDLRSESVDIHVDAPFNPLPVLAGGAVALCIVAAGLWRMKRRAAAQAAKARTSAAENALREQMTLLKQRINSADSREWLLELEGVCKGYLARRFHTEASSVNIEQLVKDGQLEGWESLAEEFAHARYGGGKRDSFENRETWKAAMSLMGVEEA